MEYFVPNHTHLIVTMTLSNPPKTTQIVYDWLIKLVKTVGMEILSGPHVEECADIGNEGVTGIVVLSTSHASLHCWSEVEIPYLQFDLYSCKDFDKSLVMKMFDEFGLKEIIHFYHIDRNIPLVSYLSEAIVHRLDNKL